MSTRGGPRGEDAYTRRFLAWDAYFAVVWAATVVFAVGAPAPGWPARALAVGFFVLLVPWYLLAGRGELLTDGQDHRRSVRYVVGLLLLFLPPAVLVGETRLVTFALVPQCFMLLRVRQALLAVVVIHIGPVTGWVLLWRPDASRVFSDVMFAVVSLAFSAVMGGWIIRIIEQSVQRAGLIAELDASREEAAQLSAAHGALAERERMSREIHDTLAQGFTSVLMLVQAVEAELDHDLPGARRHLALMDETARQNLAEARALVAGRAPADLDGGTLPDALRRLGARHSTPAAVTVTGGVRPLPAGLEVVVLRFCQETLANARRHAGPSAAVAVTAHYGDAALAVTVEDTGCGFDAQAPHDGFGLRGLRARATEVGGTTTVCSAPGEGTTVDLLLPVPAPSPRSTP